MRLNRTKNRLKIERMIKGHCCHNYFIMLLMSDHGVADCMREEISSYIKYYNVDTAIIIETSDTADFKLRVFERDGSESGACGNGSMMAWMIFGSGSGVIETKGSRFYMKKSGDVISIHCKYNSPFETPYGFFVDAGEPHIILPPGKMELNDFIGTAKDIQKYFPQGVNVNMHYEIVPDKYCIKTYERGVDRITNSCGTGSLSCFISLMHREEIFSDGRYVTFVSKGGEHFAQALEPGFMSLGVNVANIQYEDLFI